MHETASTLRHVLAISRSLMVCPEGTRTKDGKLQPFKKGAMILAIETGLPIVPVAVCGAFHGMCLKYASLMSCPHVLLLTSSCCALLLCCPANLWLDYVQSFERGQGSCTQGRLR